MAVFEASQQLLQQASGLQRGLRDVPDFLRPAAGGWQQELAALRARLRSHLFGPRVCVAGACGSGKSALINVLIGWRLLPAPTSGPFGGGGGLACPVEVVALPGGLPEEEEDGGGGDRRGPDAGADEQAGSTTPAPSSCWPRASSFEIRVQLMRPEEWAVARAGMQASAAGSGEAVLTAVRHAADETDAAQADASSDPAAEALASASARALFGERHAVEACSPGQQPPGTVLRGRFDGSRAKDRAAARAALERLCGGSPLAPAVTGVRIEGALGALPGPCTLVEVPGAAAAAADGGGAAAAVLWHAARAFPCSAAQEISYWLCLDARGGAMLEAPANRTWAAAVLAALGEDARMPGGGTVRLVCTGCDTFDPHMTCPDMMPHLEERLLEAFLRLEADNRGSGPRTPGARAFACSLAAHDALALGDDMSRRQRLFLEACGFATPADTGVPAIARHLHDLVASAKAALKPSLDELGAILRSIEECVAAGEPEECAPEGDASLFGDERLRRFEEGVREELECLDSALRFAKTQVLEPAICEAEQRWLDHAEQELLPQMMSLVARGGPARLIARLAAGGDTAAGDLGSAGPFPPAWLERASEAVERAVPALQPQMRRLRRVLRQQAPQLGLEGIAAGLVAAYVGEEDRLPAAAAEGAVGDIEGEFAVIVHQVDRLWARLVGAQQQQQQGQGPGELTSVLRAFYAGVQRCLDEALEGGGIPGLSEVPVLEVALVSQVHDLGFQRRIGLHHVIRKAAEAGTAELVANIQRIAAEAQVQAEAEQRLLAALSRLRLQSMVNAVSDKVRKYFVRITASVKDGAVQQMAAVEASLRRQAALRSVADLRGPPEAGAFLVPLLRAANSAVLEVCDAADLPGDAFRHNLERLDDVSQHLLEVCPAEMRGSFMQAQAAQVCSICFDAPVEFDLQGCRCSVPFSVCRECSPLMQTWGLCPQCRAPFHGIAPIMEDGTYPSSAGYDIRH